jgi:hypothetical protein
MEGQPRKAARSARQFAENRLAREASIYVSYARRGRGKPHAIVAKFVASGLETACMTSGFFWIVFACLSSL